MGKRRRVSLRARIEARADGRCEYCRAPQSVCGYRFHLEHVTPIADGGSNDIENRALACAACNLAKGDRTTSRDPETGRSAPLFNPRIHIWEEHFGWLDDQQTVVGLTREGRATVATLNLNDPMRLEARRLWFDADLLP